MASDWRDLSGFTSFWNSLWCADGRGTAAGSASLTLPTGITSVTASPAHPHASTLNERVLKFDAKSATHETRVTTGGGSESVITVIDNAKRWGLFVSILLYVDSAVCPAADFKVMGSVKTSDDTGTPAEWKIELTSARLVKLYINNSLAATSAVAFADASWRELQLWHILNAAGGTDLATDQWVVRMSSAATGAVTWTTLININQNSVNALSTQIGQFQTIFLGSTTTDAGSGTREFNIGNCVSGWQDADNPLGIFRFAFKDPLARSGGTNMDQWTTHVVTNIDEAAFTQGQGSPDDVTTYDESAFALLSTRTQMYTTAGSAGTTAVNYITGTDIVIGVRNCQRLDIFAVGKGGSTSMLLVIGDGTNLTLSSASDGLSDTAVYLTRCQTERLNPAGSAWSVADMATFEVGARHINAAAVSSTARDSTSTAVILYQASAETGTAIDAPVASGFKHNWGVVI